jgi:TRAP transporter TAXI family solute receptor
MDNAQPSRRKWVVWGLVIGLSAVVVLASVLFTESAPPSHIRMATGQPKGGYDTFGHEYKQRLGLTVELVNTNGSIENLKLLLEGKVDVAFVQGGTAQVVNDPEHKLRGLAAIYLEPLWVFCAGEAPASVAQFEGKRISIGPLSSGTEAVSIALLKTHGIDAKNSTLVNLAGPAAAAALKEGKLDIAMMVGTADDPVVQALLRQKGVKLMSFKREIAYTRTFPYLTPVKVAAGLLDLRDDIPPEDVVLLAPAAMLVCREDLHPRVVEQILKVAQSLHAHGSKLEGPKSYPTLDGLDLPPHEAAETYMKSGESFLSRVLPYWAMRMMVHLKIFVLPLLLVWVPAFKLLPMIYQWRIDSLLKRHYSELREVETHLVQATTPDELRIRIFELDTLRKNMERISRKVPGLYQRDVYHWRLHIFLVRQEAVERLHRLEQRAAQPGISLLGDSLASSPRLAGSRSEPEG